MYDIEAISTMLPTVQKGVSSCLRSPRITLAPIISTDKSVGKLNTDRRDRRSIGAETLIDHNHMNINEMILKR